MAWNRLLKGKTSKCSFHVGHLLQKHKFFESMQGTPKKSSKSFFTCVARVSKNLCSSSFCLSFVSLLLFFKFLHYGHIEANFVFAMTYYSVEKRMPQFVDYA